MKRTDVEVLEFGESVEGEGVGELERCVCRARKRRCEEGRKASVSFPSCERTADESDAHSSRIDNLLSSCTSYESPPMPREASVNTLLTAGSERVRVGAPRLERAVAGQSLLARKDGARVASQRVRVGSEPEERGEGNQRLRVVNE